MARFEYVDKTLLISVSSVGTSTRLEMPAWAQMNDVSRVMVPRITELPAWRRYHSISSIRNC